MSCTRNRRERRFEKQLASWVEHKYRYQEALCAEVLATMLVYSAQKATIRAIVDAYDEWAPRCRDVVDVPEGPKEFVARQLGDPDRFWKTFTELCQVDVFDQLSSTRTKFVRSLAAYWSHPWSSTATAVTSLDPGPRPVLAAS